MNINGFQKLTLLDFPGRVACTIFTAGCNFRCPFCHNAGLVTHIDADAAIQEEEIFSYLKKRVGILAGVCITGGEPLLQNDIEEFIAKIKAMGFEVKLDTNGSFPQKLISLVEKGLVDYVAMDIKNGFEKYFETAGVECDLSAIKKSIDFLKESQIDYEFRTTVVNGIHTVWDIKSISEIIGEDSKYFLQNFKDSGDIIGENLSPVEKEELQNMREAASIASPKVQIRSE